MTIQKLNHSDCNCYELVHIDGVVYHNKDMKILWRCSRCGADSYSDDKEDNVQ